MPKAWLTMLRLGNKPYIEYAFNNIFVTNLNDAEGIESSQLMFMSDRKITRYQDSRLTDCDWD